MTAAPTIIFPWREAYSVQIPQIDGQHKHLIKLINDLHASMLAGGSRETLARILDDLIRYTEIHFRDEERLLEQRGYGKLGVHRLEHKRLCDQVYDLKQRLATGRVTLGIEIMRFLKDWLANHILVHDQEYARALASR